VHRDPQRDGPRAARERAGPISVDRHALPQARDRPTREDHAQDASRNNTVADGGSDAGAQQDESAWVPV